QLRRRARRVRPGLPRRALPARVGDGHERRLPLHAGHPEHRLRGAVTMRRAMTILSTLFILASPWGLYLTLSQDRVDVAALALVGWVIVRSLPTLITARREDLAAALRLPAIALVFAVLGWIFDSGWMLLILPSATQAAFGLTFLS